MTTIDHAAEAQKHYEEAVTANRENKWETARFEMQLAKFHTEAALAEQQRIANLVAFTDAVAASVRAGEKPSAIVWERIESAGKQIIEGLGL